ncbi:hypothetical protein Q8F55_004444 [Vanrija albida]|uniref:Tautomerase cis-CaaD-like domain-containing protein n=1 Tax=Vanrija albida TaxID=181172 RepID=A0ABR3Q7W0_9TREE
MPTYVAKVPAGLLSAAQKLALARAITTRHNQASGAPKFIAQVVIDEDGPTSTRYVGGEPASEADARGHIWIRGDIKAGRTPEFKEQVALGIVDDVAAISGVRREFVWVYLDDIAVDGLVEFGKVLPKSVGEEAAWYASLPEDIRAKLGK